MNILNLLQSCYYEFLSYFVSERMYYVAKGKCKQCGRCCRYMYSMGTSSETDFRIMQFLFPKYRRFEIAGRDEHGNFVFACKLIGKDNLCPDYENRLYICRRYHMFKYKNIGNFHPGCGFEMVPEKEFKSFLDGK